MKVTTNTPDLLIVDSRPWLWSLLTIVIVLGCIGIGFAATADGAPLIGLAFGVAGVIAGGGVFWAVTERSQLVFDRAENRLQIRRKRIAATSQIPLPLASVTGARVVTSLDTEATSSRKSRKLVIDLDASAGAHAGPHPVDRMASNVGNHWDIAEHINAWLEPA